MKLSNEVLAGKQDALLAALLAKPTLREAAAAVGLSDVTVWRWLQQPEFSARYQQVRRQILENAICELQGAASEAVRALKRNLTCGNAATEVRAASAVLAHVIKASEYQDLAARLDEIERLLMTVNGGEK
jgi:hypothetical protein